MTVQDRGFGASRAGDLLTVPIVLAGLRAARRVR
jgi:hypothetical protein